MLIAIISLLLLLLGIQFIIIAPIFFIFTVILTLSVAYLAGYLRKKQVIKSDVEYY